MPDFRFLFNRYIRRQRIVDGFRYEFKAGVLGGNAYETFFRPMILSKGDIFIDVGANVGGWSIPASKHYNTVMSFEADPEMAHVLARNLSRNSVSNVQVFPVALGDKNETRIFYRYPGKGSGKGSGSHSFLPEHLNEKTTGETIRIPVRTLDSYAFRPSVVKVDTEGWEVSVLTGAIETLKRSRPKLCIETHLPGDTERIKTLLPEYDWQVNPRNAQHLMIGIARP